MIKNFMLLIACVLLNICGFAQFDDNTSFSTTPYHLGRYSTSQKDVDAGLFLPQYKELASDPDTGITLNDWKNSFLSLDRFLLLDKNSDSIISKEELNDDIVMGEVQRYEQLLSDVSKYKSKFPEYNKQLSKMDASRKPEEKIVYFLPKNTTNEELATKTYIQLLQGKANIQKVTLTDYALLQLEDIQEKNPLYAHLYFFSFVVILGVITLLILFAIQKKQTQLAS